ncbi:TRAP transporter large permease [Nesterenkonia populi]|uniref:TRAP transporter large permease n=1 Tax=Nesterenkonia populi TaxID=1591087 RepID=UPI001478D26E|nr:TRAP transporter large permease [Nesterenkonia populi]
MTTGMIITAVLVLLVALLLFRVPVAIALGGSGAVGLLLLHSFDYTTNLLGSEPFGQTASFGLTIIPMFILMGMFAVRAHVAEYVFRIADSVLGRFPGGLGVATVAASAGFSAVSGSSIGTAATMARLSVAEMRAAGYPASLATALVAVAGTLGSMIPPSTFLVLYAILAQQSVGQMLAAGIVPGVLTAIAYSAYLVIAGQRLKRKGVIRPPHLRHAVSEHVAAAKTAKTTTAGSAEEPATVAAAAIATEEPPAGPESVEAVPPQGAASRKPTPLKELPWRGLFYIAALFCIVLGGMYSGYFTATESAAFGAIAAVLILLFELRKTGLRGISAGIAGALRDTASTTAMVFFIVIGSGILTAFFVAARVPQMITDAVMSVNLPPMVVMALLLLALIPLGMMLESLSILVISVPLLLPIATEFGFDAIWLGILIVKLIEIGMVTPPVGINAFVVAGTTGLPSETVFRGIVPFFVVDLALIALFFFWPDLVLLLPSYVAEGAG